MKHECLEKSKKRLSDGTMEGTEDSGFTMQCFSTKATDEITSKCWHPVCDLPKIDT